MTGGSATSPESAHLRSLALPEQTPLHLQVLLETPVRLGRLRVLLHYPFRGALRLFEFFALLLLPLPEFKFLSLLSRRSLQLAERRIYKNSYYTKDKKSLHRVTVSVAQMRCTFSATIA